MPNSIGNPLRVNDCPARGKTNEAIRWLQEVVALDRNRRDVVRMIRDLRWEENERKSQNKKLDVALTIRTEDADALITDPNHRMAVTGTADSPWLGGKMPIDSGEFNLLVSTVDPRKKEMRYRLFVRHSDGTERTIAGVKHVSNDGGITDIWDDTTTLFTSIYKGHVLAADEPTADLVATGIIRIGLFDFIQEMTTFQVTGPTPASRLNALTRFTTLFMGKLLDVYGGLLSTS